MILKAGTYRFNDVITPMLTLSAEEIGDLTDECLLPLNFTDYRGNSFIGISCVLLDGEYSDELVSNIKCENYCVLHFDKDANGNGESYYTTGKAIVGEIEINGAGWNDDYYPDCKTITVLKDAEADATKGAWFIDNTNYNEVNGAITITWDGQLEGREQITSVFPNGAIESESEYLIAEIEVPDVNLFIGSTFEVYADSSNGYKILSIKSPITEVNELFGGIVHFGVFSVMYNDGTEYSNEEEGVGAFIYAEKGEHPVYDGDVLLGALIVPKTGIYSDLLAWGGEKPNIVPYIYPSKLTIPAPKQPEPDPEEPEEPDIPEPVTISFLINRNGTIYTYNAKEGRTWREWVVSGDDYYGDKHFIIVSSDPDYIAYKSGADARLDVGVDDVIEDGKTYYTIVDEPEEPEVPEEPEEPKPKPRTIEFSFQEDEHSYGGDAQEGSTWREWVVKQNSKYWQIVSDDTEYIMHTLNDGRRYRLDVAVDNVIEEFRTYYLILILEPSPRRFSRLYDGVVLQESGEKKIKRVQAEWLGYELSDDETYYTCTGFGASQGKKVIIASDIGGIPVTHIGSNAFQYCSTPISIIIPNSVTNINGSTFRYCYSLKNITIPASVTSGSVRFNYCTALESIEVEDDSPKYKSIDGNLYNKDGTSLYQYALGKKDTSFTVPETVSYIQGGAFEGCLYLKDLNIHGGALTTIRDNAFNDCESIKNITIGNVNRIGKWAFGYCYNLENITISSAVTSIDPFAFYKCYSIKNFIVDADNPEYEAIDGSLYTKINKYQTKYLWRYASGKKDDSFTIPDSVTTIAQQAFNWSLSLKNVIIPDSVTKVGSYAFSYCDNLESVTMGNSVKVISHYAFENCSKLANINLPDSLTFIGDLAFSECSLTSITIPSSVNYIGKWGLNCRKLNNIIFKGTVEQWNAISLGEDWNLNVPATYVQCTDGQVAL